MKRSKQRIIPHLWFDDEAEHAASLYTSLFDRSTLGGTTHYGKEGQDIHGRPEGAVMTVDFDLAGYSMIALNGGPHFTLNPTISLFVVCETESEIDELWAALSEGGGALMPLDAYDWSEKYGWVQDRFGLTWQLSVGKLSDVGQKITPSVLFAGDQYGRAEEAVHFYTSIFDNSNVEGILRHEAGEHEKEGTVKHAQFTLDGEVFMAMDSGMDHEITFNEATSLLIECESQEEVDYFWGKLVEGGQEQQCGWLKDQFGVSWQVSPTVLREMITDPDEDKVSRVTQAYLKMKKFDIEELRRAFEGKSTEGKVSTHT